MTTDDKNIKVILLSGIEYRRESDTGISDSLQRNESVEAATGIEPVKNGFADRRLYPLAMPPQHRHDPSLCIVKHCLVIDYQFIGLSYYGRIGRFKGLVIAGKLVVSEESSTFCQLEAFGNATDERFGHIM
jgi:hypothetical protein